jgi:site-specific recombinase XerC
VLSVTGKYARQRLVPIHPSTLEALSDYQSVRAALTGKPPAGPLLVGARGGRLSAGMARSIFRRVADDCALPARPGNPTPRLHDYADLRVMPTSSRQCWSAGVGSLRLSA